MKMRLEPGSASFGCWLLYLLGGLAAGPLFACSDWLQWERFRSELISQDGRVIDYSRRGGITTSEGQAYGLFFALVANDHKTFERLLTWTRDNLAQGSLEQRLPAWLWGNDGSGAWRILDDTSASDADMWMAYTLLEAGRLWRDPRYSQLGKKLLRHILVEETAVLPGVGELVLPGPFGFVSDERSWRLNPSYLPLFQLRYFAGIDPRWRAIGENSLALLQAASPHGFAPDWVLYRVGEGFVRDHESKGIGSYDAIRVYLWAGMLDPQDPAREPLLAIFSPMRSYLQRHGVPPRLVDSTNGQTQGIGSSGFSAALLPILTATDDHEALITQLSRLLEDPPWDARERYYDQVLSLFGLGWHLGRYRFDRLGRLQPAWMVSCR